jgi:hypothetical protein
MLVAGQHLDAQVREVEFDEVDSTLISVEEPDAPIGRDPEVGWTGIAVDHRDARSLGRGEHGENIGCYVVREPGHVGIDARVGSVQFEDGSTTQALVVAGEVDVEPMQLVGHHRPVLVGVGLASLDPALNDDAVGR